jgi:hypothetical protein
VIGQVQVVCILMIIQGVLECLLGMIVGLGGFLFPDLIRSINLMVQEEQKRQPAGPPIQGIPEEFGWLMTALIVAMALGALVAGLLKITAGIRGLEYRGRVHGIVALFCSILAFPICYCAPTGLGVMIYGLIVYFNGDVGRAFAMAQKGKSPQEIRAYFAGRQHRGPSDFEPPPRLRREKPDEPGPPGEPDERIER